MLKLRDKGGHETKVRIAPDEAFKRMFDGYKKHAVDQGWVTDAIELKYVFDGNKVSPESTPEEVDAEDDCVIDVSW